MVRCIPQLSTSSVSHRTTTRIMRGLSFHYCTTVFTTYPPLILVSSPSSPVSRGRGGGGTGGELAPSLLIAPRRRLLLIVAGDVEINPGPLTDYGE